MFSRIRSAVVSGIEGQEVFVETDISRGLPNVCIVGLASTMVMESRERIRSAVENSGYEFPHSRITVNLTPASLRKTGSCLDLPISIGILTSIGAVCARHAEEYGIVGELSLDGMVLGIDGVLPMILMMKRKNIKKVIIPESNRLEASLISGIEIYAVSNLGECVRVINESELGAFSKVSRSNGDKAELPRIEKYLGYDFGDIAGQESAKRAIIIAVTGRHGLLMIGSPGCGKTMLAKRIPTIMPRMSENEMIETAMIYSVMGKNNRDAMSGACIIDRPYRSPHHTIGRAGLIGGGVYPVPGEITLAHNGVLFLDEACEFDLDKIEALRQPLEERTITHLRQGIAYTYPCNFQLVMASNPCPCGFFGDSERVCRCTEVQLHRYRKKLSGPIVDRIDMRICMEKVTYSDIRDAHKGTDSSEMRKQVEDGIAFARKHGRLISNAELSDADIEKYCAFDEESEIFMKRAYSSLKMSPRSYVRTIKVARTIADLDESATIQLKHLTEALSYRITETVNE